VPLDNSVRRRVDEAGQLNSMVGGKYVVTLSHWRHIADE
jgi:hypothetical protein